MNRYKTLYIVYNVMISASAHMGGKRFIKTIFLDMKIAELYTVDSLLTGLNGTGDKPVKRNSG